MKKLIIILVLIFATFISQGEANAKELSSGASASLNSTVTFKENDNRAQILRGFLEQYDSPMAGEAENFVKYADQNNLDWRLVASIAGLESTFGKHTPYNSYNAWGWGVYGDNVIRFESWEEGIATISEGLRMRYLKDNTESDPYIIGPTYAASPTWAVRVSFFMSKMEEYRLKNAKSSLALAL